MLPLWAICVEAGFMPDPSVHLKWKSAQRRQYLTAILTLWLEQPYLLIPVAILEQLTSALRA